METFAAMTGSVRLWDGKWLNYSSGSTETTITATPNDVRRSLRLQASVPRHPIDDLVGAVLELRGAFLDYQRATR